MSPVPEAFKLINVEFHIHLVRPGVDLLEVCLESRAVIGQDNSFLDSGIICKGRFTGANREILRNISDVD